MKQNRPNQNHQTPGIYYIQTQDSEKWVVYSNYHSKNTQLAGFYYSVEEAESAWFNSISKQNKPTLH
jgi:hypothetical protein